MGSSGHKFISHTKALSPAPSVSDGGYGLPPHPLGVRAGQRFWPRRGRRRRLFVVRRVKDGRAIISWAGGEREESSVPVERLVARRRDGQGFGYQFHGFTSRSYNTFAYVAAFDADEAILSLPEWHPRRPVSFLARLLPRPARHEGAWLTLRCDLAAACAAHLQLNTIQVGEDPGASALERPQLDLCPAIYTACASASIRFRSPKK